MTMTREARRRWYPEAQTRFVEPFHLPPGMHAVRVTNIIERVQEVAMSPFAFDEWERYERREFRAKARGWFRGRG